MNNSPAGLVTLAVVVLWVAYLVPHKLRHRQQLLESRADDRFSEALRVLAVTDRSRAPALPRSRAGAGTDCAPTAEKKIGLLTSGRGVSVVVVGGANGGGVVDRPHGAQERRSADMARRTAQQHAAHAAALARRGAAARRRAVLAGSLLVASVAGWAVVGLTTLTVAAAVTPSVLLASVLVLGRRAVVQGHAADAEWARRRREAGLAPARPSADAPAVTGRAFRPSEAHTEVFARITDEVATPTGETARATSSTPVVRRSSRDTAPGTADEWSPVAVPRPTYTLKASAPHREPAPLGEVEGSTAIRTSHADRLVSQTGTRAGEAVESAARRPLEAPASTTGSINLDEILARRRAAGE